MDIDKQMQAYAEFMRARDIKTVAVFPMKKSGNTVAARIQLAAALQGFNAGPYYPCSQSSAHTLQDKAEVAGYTFVEVDLEDYIRLKK